MRTPSNYSVVVNGRGCSTPRHRPLASVAPPIERFNSLFRFVQQSGQRCNGYEPTRDIDPVDNFSDGRNQGLATIPANDINIVRPGLEHFDDPAELPAVCGDDHAEADQFVDEVGLVIVAEDVIVGGFEEFAAEAFDCITPTDAGELEDPLVVVGARLFDGAADALEVDRAAALHVPSGG